MRKLLAAAVLVLGGLGAVACQPTEPAMTITASASKTKPKCSDYSIDIDGTVSPYGATNKVVLQRSVGGKWTDFKWYRTSDSDEQRTVVEDTSIRSPGEFSMGLQLAYHSESLRGTFHFRVRSSGGTRFSNSVYVTFPSC